MKYGLIGERLGHSFSKNIHEKLGYEYELRQLKPEELDRFMREKDFLGINVTIPYKEAVIPYLDEIDEGARAIGAVNTIVNRDGRLFGHNTDFYGMKELIRHLELDVEDRKAIILGTGGTSKTAKAALTSLGAKEVIKVSRSKNDEAIDYQELLSKHLDAEIIVNTTPVGMYPDIRKMPVDIYKFQDLVGLIDAVYNPINPFIVQCAHDMAVTAEGGLYMLVAQAVRASEIFLDKSYPDGLIDDIYNDLRREKENIVLIGMPASGKSTVGKIVAERLGRKFVDTDEIITERIGMSIKEYFEQYGEVEFRKIESEIIADLACETSLVIATGGGAILADENVCNLKFNGLLFFIDRPLECLIPTEDRPLSSDRESITKRYYERYLVYRGTCDVHIESDLGADNIADMILENF